MRLKSFFVRGFRNLTGPISFGPLEVVNTLHGPNNLGKSNLLQAMDLYFRLLGYDEVISKTNEVSVEPRDETFKRLLATAFNREKPEPITFRVEWELPKESLEASGMLAMFPTDRTLMELELKPSNRLVSLRFEKLLLNDTDAAAANKEKDAELVGFAKQVRRVLADSRPFEFDLPVHPVAFLGQPESELLPQRLHDALFDARQSLNPKRRRRWSLFAQLADEFRDALGPGTLDTAFDRTTGRAELIYEVGGEALPLRGMGAGIQQALRLLAELVLTEERWIFLEEPESRLGPIFQERFGRLAAGVVAAGVGPLQIFLTTHSPTMAGVGQSFGLDMQAEGPVLQRRPWQTPVAAPAGGPRAAAPAPAGAPQRPVFAPANGPRPAAPAGAPVGAPTAPAPAGAQPAQPADLGDLIGLVEDLEKIDPTKLVGSGANPAAPAPQPPGQQPGDPAWKWQGKK